MNHYYFEFRDAIKFVKHELNKDPEVVKKNNLDRWFRVMIILILLIIITTALILINFHLSIIKPTSIMVKPTPIVKSASIVNPAPIVKLTPIINPAPIVKPTPIIKPILMVEQILLIELIGSFVIFVIMLDKVHNLKIDNTILKKMSIEQLSAYLDSCNYTDDVLLKIKTDISETENRNIERKNSSLNFFTSIVFGIFVAILPGTAGLIGHYVDEKIKKILAVITLVATLYIFAFGRVLIKEHYNVNYPDKIQKIINSIDEVLIYRKIKVDQTNE